ncbi:MAG: hypothetical protein WC827_00820 [Candidatus Paceibacterota bacterium]|jgi:hypothetical protein
MSKTKKGDVMQNKTSSVEQKSMTEDQIEEVVSDLRVLLTKHSTEFTSEAVRLALEQSGFFDKMFQAFRRCVKTVSGLIIFHVVVDRKQEPVDALKATGCVLNFNDADAEMMPKGDGEKTEIFFFRVGRSINDDELDKEYKQHGFIPADPYSLAKVVQDNNTFASEHSIATHWKDKNDKWCVVRFNSWGHERRVYVGRNYVRFWSKNWWFAGICK